MRWRMPNWPKGQESCLGVVPYCVNTASVELMSKMWGWRGDRVVGLVTMEKIQEFPLRLVYSRFFSVHMRFLYRFYSFIHRKAISRHYTCRIGCSLCQHSWPPWRTLKGWGNTEITTSRRGCSLCQHSCAGNTVLHKWFAKSKCCQDQE